MKIISVSSRSIFLLIILLWGYDLVAQNMIESYNAYRHHISSSLNRTQWKSIGPTVNSARAEAVQGVPGRPGWLYVAFGSGNLWRSKNDGISWEAIFENQPAQGIGDIAIAPSDPDILYVGCGESCENSETSPCRVMVFTVPMMGVITGSTWDWMSRGILEKSRYTRITPTLYW